VSKKKRAVLYACRNAGIRGTTAYLTAINIVAKTRKFSEITKLCRKKVIAANEFLQTSVVAVNDFRLLLYLIVQEVKGEKDRKRTKVKELDARTAELNALYENESELKKQKENLSS